jgi:aminopeptidase N
MKNVIALISCIAGGWLMAQNSPSQISTVDFINARAVYEIDTLKTEVKGSVSFDFEILTPTDSIFIDAKNLSMLKVFLDGDEIPAVLESNRIIVKNDFNVVGIHQLDVNFTSQPTKALYFIDANSDGVWEQAWTQGQGKYTSNWLPSIDDTNDKMVWEQEITAPQGLNVIANGSLNKMDKISGKTVYKYVMTSPMSSYLVAFAAGNYSSYKEVSETGVRLEYYFYPTKKSEALTTYKNTLEMFDFLEREIGIAYPWQNYKQVPVKDFLYSGMENTSVTIFNDQFLVDEIGVNDRNYTTVNAHEMAHQWFGNLVTAATSSDHWLQEGFATYYSMLAERELYGENHFQILLYQHAEALTGLNNSGSKKALTDPAASSLTFYQHGAWALHALKDLVGEDRFRQSVITYLKAYAFKNASTQDFLNVVSEVSGMDLTSYEKIWLRTPAFPTEDSLRLLRKSMFMEAFFQLAARRMDTFDDAFQSYKETLRSPVQKDLVKELIAQLAQRDDPRKYDLLLEASQIPSIEIRQLIALSTKEINDRNRVMMESMLTDDSYITRENALYLLWRDAADKRVFLNATKKSWKQQSNPSINIAWYALALSTPSYSDKEVVQFLAQIRTYTSASYDTQTRTAAFDFLISLDIMSLLNYQDLIDASHHHVWRFYERSRDLLRSLYKGEQSKSMINQAMLLLDPEDLKKTERVLRID